MLSSCFKNSGHLHMPTNRRCYWKVTTDKPPGAFWIDLAATSSRPNLNQLRQHLVEIQGDSTIRRFKDEGAERRMISIVLGSKRFSGWVRSRPLQS